jgi:hypothetical protein
MTCPSMPNCIEYWPIDRLVPYVNNPRKNNSAVDQMCASIEEFGFKIPCLVRSSGEGLRWEERAARVEVDADHAEQYF